MTAAKAQPRASKPSEPRASTNAGKRKPEEASKKSAWGKLPRRLRFTREGKFFTFVTCGVGVAAINTGNNLLYLVLGLMLSLIVLSGVLSELSLRQLTFVRKLPRRAFAGSPVLVELEVHNDKRWAPSYSVEVEDRVEGRVTDKRCYFLKVSPGAKQTAAYRRTAPIRGRERYLGLRVATRFPFGLFEKWREVDLEETHIVLPTPARVANVQQTSSEGQRDGTRAHAARGTGDIDGLRELREGEFAREIDWKKSAASVKGLIARERASESSRKLRIELRNGPSEREREGFADEFEEEIKVVAGRALQALERGAVVELHASDNGSGRSAHLVAHPGREGSDRVLYFLALLPPLPQLPKPSR
ncbi:MAG: DUF58 domain-containing protein [Deltaproteobacteria bacterium]|nr:DUF58 domain-containing protein [Deltaproteobacteria bacterium]